MLKYSVLAFLCFLFARGTAYVQQYQHRCNLAVFCAADGSSEVCPSDGERLYDAFTDQFRRVNIDIRDVIRGGARQGENDVLKQGTSDDGLDTKRQRLSRLKDWLDSFRPLSGDIVATIKSFYDVYYTYHSNAIEGNTLNQRETSLVLESGITVGGKKLSEHLEVIGHKDAIDYVEALSKKSMRITEFEIRQIHSLICRGTMPEEAGRYRNVQVKAGGTNYQYPDSYLVPQMMTDFVDWLEQREEDTNPFDFASEAHLRFVTIHPFLDGNGRTARLLMNLLLLRSGYPIVVITNELRSDYIDAFVAAQQRGNENCLELKSLIMDFLEVSLVDTLFYAGTAGSSRGKGVAFYKAILGETK